MDQTGARVVGRAVLALVLSSSLLACPPTTVSKGDQEQVWLGSPYGWLLPESPTLLTNELPEFPNLPLWDLEATRAELGNSGDRVWLRSVIDDAESKPLSSHGKRVAAFSSSTLSPEWMLWWLRHAPLDDDARDALSDAYDRTDSVRGRLLLAIALALVQVEASCPVESGPDGACRMPGTSIATEQETLIRRNDIALERSNDWAREAAKLAKRAKIEPSEIAMQALLAELEFAMMTADYESMLVARLPEDYSFLVDHPHGSGNSAWERTYERQVETQAKSRGRVEAFELTYIGCIEEQFNDYALVERTSPNAAMLASLRRAKLMLAFADHADGDERSRRDEARMWNEHELREQTWICVSSSISDSMLSQALRQARQCVEIGTTLGGSGEILEACFNLLEALDSRHVPIAEFVPEPGARTTTMHAAGVVPPG